MKKIKKISWLKSLQLKLSREETEIRLPGDTEVTGPKKKEWLWFGFKFRF